MRVVVINHVTPDGDMQAPGRPDEDIRDGFTYGGWSSPNSDGVMMDAVGARLSEGNRLLLGGAATRTCSALGARVSARMSTVHAPGALSRQRAPGSFR